MWTYIAPSAVRKRPLVIVSHSILAGVLAALALNDLSINNVIEYVGNSLTVGWFLVVFGWLSVLQALNSMLISTPAEIAIYRALDTNTWGSMTRPIHLLVIFAALKLVWNDNHLVFLIIYVILACMPVIWMLGWLPPTELFVLWLMEQIQVYVLGGTPTTSIVRSIFNFSISIIPPFIAIFVGQNNEATFAGLALSGYFISLDVFGLIQSIWLLFKPKSKKIAAQKQLQNEHKKKILDFKHAKISLPVLTHLPFMMAAFGVTCFVPICKDCQDLELNISGLTIVVCFVTVKICSQLQKVYGVFGLILSPFYRPATKSGYFNQVLIAAKSVVCLVYVYFIKANLLRDMEGAVGSWIQTIATFRAFRWIWQSTNHCMLEVCMLYCLKPLQIPIYDDLSTPLKLLVLSFARDRIRQIFDKTFLLFALSSSALHNRLRRTHVAALLQLDIILSPFIMAFVIISSVAGAPILPLFTLPIFLIACPRTVRFWPDNSSSPVEESVEDDSAYYRQMSLPLLKAIHKTVLCHSEVGSHFLARHDDRIMWIQVLERGNGYMVYKLKGMELQETSCHSVEATKMDELIQMTFERKPILNRYPLHTFTPVTQISDVLMYSTSSNSLTGVLEAPSTLRMISNTFAMIVVFQCVKYCKTNSSRKSDKDNAVQIESDDLVRPFDSLDVDCEPDLRPSSSIEAVNLNSWPVSTETTPDRDKLAGSLPSTAWTNHGIDLSSDEEEDMIRRPVKLPPIKKQLQLSEDSAKFLQPVSHWLDLAQELCVQPVHEDLDKWILKCLEFHCISESHVGIFQAFRLLAGLCLELVYGRLEGNFTGAFPALICKVFAGTLPPHSSRVDDNLTNSVIVHSMRCAVKLSIDHAVSVLDFQPETEHEKIIEALNNLGSHWYLGMESDPEWWDAVSKNVPFLFSVVAVDGLGGQKFRSKLVQLKECQVSIGSLNSEVVRSLWASLVFELLYLTNDDDERYSIQADEMLFRNLTVEASDPPLGYAVYSSKPIKLSNVEN